MYCNNWNITISGCLDWFVALCSYRGVDDASYAAICLAYLSSQLWCQMQFHQFIFMLVTEGLGFLCCFYVFVNTLHNPYVTGHRTLDNIFGQYQSATIYSYWHLALEIHFLFLVTVLISVLILVMIWWHNCDLHIQYYHVSFITLNAISIPLDTVQGIT